jgi:hypothetical protein
MIKQMNERRVFLKTVSGLFKFVFGWQGNYVTVDVARISVSNPVYTDTGIPVFGTPNTDTDTDTGKTLPVFAYTPYYWFLPCS